jgi:predicted MFS family arabinose efflux permease
MLGGVLSIKFGARNVLILFFLVGSIFTLAVPLAAAPHAGFGALVACRFLVGVRHGVFWPAMSTLWVFDFFII